MKFSALPSFVSTLLTAAVLLTVAGCSSATNSDVPPVSTDPAVSVDLDLNDPASAQSTVTDETEPEVSAAPATEESPSDVSKQQTATFGAGCFWCVEAVFEQLKGVENVRSGYAGGKPEDADYKLVSRGNTGHAEVIQFDFDPSVITYEELLEVFWTSHDPTTLNRQGADVGTQYRSSILYHDEKQRELAEAYKKRLNDENAFGSPIVTEIVKFEGFYNAEGYHQDYFALNGSTDRYCQFVVRPKVEKVRKVFADKLKSK